MLVSCRKVVNSLMVDIPFLDDMLGKHAENIAVCHSHAAFLVRTSQCHWLLASKSHVHARATIPPYTTCSSKSWFDVASHS